MAKQLEFALSLSVNACRMLRAGAAKYGATDEELRSIDRLEEFRGSTVDVDRLAKLADFVGLPWDELWSRNT